MDSTMATSCGVSRSGRVRKKPAKLMEMELSMDDRLLSLTGERPMGSYVTNKTAALSSALMGSGSPVLPTSPPPLPPEARRQTPKSSSSSALPVVHRVQPPTCTRVQTSDFSRTLLQSDDREQSSPRVIAIKALDTSPTFDNLSGSTYLIGDDVHFITGEPVDSELEQDDDDDDEDGDVGHHRGYRLSPLKVDIGGHVIDEGAHSTIAATSLNHGDDGDGIRMKFILSPKTSSSSSFDKIKGDKSKSKKSKKSSKSHSKKSSSGVAGSSSNSSKSKKKKKAKQGDEDRLPLLPPPSPALYPPDSFRGMPVLEVLASGGELPCGSFRAGSDSDDVDSESKLIIAEPPILQPMVPIGKSKKKSDSSGGGVSKGTSSSKLKKKGGGSSSKSLQKEQHLAFSSDIGGNVPAVAAEVLGQQHSVYLKEKNASKKKSGKKTAKTKDKGANYKARPMSAYMLWCREYRAHIVKENPGIDFATISKRLGEVWQSLSEFEKMNWRRKAKVVSSCKPATTSNVINTGKKRTDSVSKHGGGEGGGGISSKLLHRTQAGVAAAVRVTEDAAGQLAVARPVGTTPLDVAAHLKLLGESLSIIGQRLTEHEGQIAVSGSLSVLLDSTLCALGPLVCLTSEVDQLDGCAKFIQERILDNIAYIMPGL